MTILTFPELSGLTYPSIKRPMMATDFQRSISGKASALQLMSYPLWNIELSYTFLRSTTATLEFQTLAAFFLQNGGRACAWAFHDPDDDTATNQVFGTGDGATTEFRLVRTISGGGFSFTEPVFVMTDVVSITVNGTPNLTYREGNGVIKFSVAPANGAVLAWTGTYNWICRFDEDVQEFEKFAYRFWELKKITFTSEPGVYPSSFARISRAIVTDGALRPITTASGAPLITA